MDVAELYQNEEIRREAALKGDLAWLVQSCRDIVGLTSANVGPAPCRIEIAKCIREVKSKIGLKPRRLARYRRDAPWRVRSGPGPLRTCPRRRSAARG